ncbi:MAG: hypothetical protein J7K36_09060 [Archaeoglobaceae archaeon]|nr:hypothetical protein [Archaeoglobaceae archaeon]
MEEKINVIVKYKGKKPSIKDLKFEGQKIEGDKVINLKLGEIKFEKVRE